MDVLRETNRSAVPETPAASPEDASAIAQAHRHPADHDLLFVAMEASSMPMVVTDPRQPDNPIVAANRAFVAMSGYAHHEIVGRNCRFLQGPRTDAASVEAIRDAIRDREEIAIELLNYRKDGSAFWNALFVSPVFDRTGELLYHFASQFDVSRRHDAEAALAQAQKMEAVGQLTGGIAHDFNNLLQVMLGHVDLLDRRLQQVPVDADAAAKASRSIRTAIDKASTLTQQMLAFARKQHLDARRGNLNRLVERLMGLATRSLGGDVRIVTDLAPGLRDCLIDGTQFEAGLLNVLRNANDALRGHGTVTIRTWNVAIEAEDLRSFAGLEAGRYVVIAVTDDGPGIPRDILARVMEPFFTTKEEGKGTGLGLSMVHGFVKQSGGGIQIYSESGLGTTIQLYFPSLDDEREAAAAPAAPGPRERGGHDIVLVVDDRPEVLDTARTLLEELGYRVLTAGSGVDALALVEGLATSERPALLFSDVIMPGGMNGYMLARRLRLEIPTLKVLLTTGYAGDVMGLGDDDSAFEVIKKPYKLDELARRVRMVLHAAAA